MHRNYNETYIAFKKAIWYNLKINTGKKDDLMNHIIKIDSLYKSFGDIKAVDNLSLRVNEGELFAFLGVNGAGKSTTISIMCSQLKKDSGYIEICGKPTDGNASVIAERLGVVFQNSVLDGPLTVSDNLKSRAALYGITGKEYSKREAELSRLLDFKELLGRSVSKLSGGQRRRIDIARALIHRPQILILDEPTTGLDPQTRKMLWDTISALRRDEKMTVFLTTHYMEEAADADYVVIIDSGRVAAEGTPHMLKSQYTGDFITLYGAEEYRIKELGLPFTRLRGAYRLSVPDTKSATELIIKYPDLFTDYEITRGKMDDVFLAVTGKQLTEDNR